MKTMATWSYNQQTAVAKGEPIDDTERLAAKEGATLRQVDHNSSIQQARRTFGLPHRIGLRRLYMTHRETQNYCARLSRTLGASSRKFRRLNDEVATWIANAVPGWTVDMQPFSSSKGQSLCLVLQSPDQHAIAERMASNVKMICLDDSGHFLFEDVCLFAFMVESDVTYRGFPSAYLLYLRCPGAAQNDKARAIERGYRKLFSLHRHLRPTLQMTDKDVESLRAWYIVSSSRVLAATAKCMDQLSTMVQPGAQMRQDLGTLREVCEGSRDCISRLVEEGYKSWRALPTTFGRLREQCPELAAIPASSALREGLGCRALLCQFHVMRALGERLPAFKLVCHSVTALVRSYSIAMLKMLALVIRYS